MAVTTQAPRDLTGCKVNLYLEVGTKSWTIDNVTIVDDLRNELVIKGDSGTQKIDKREVVDMEILKLPNKRKMNEDTNMSFRDFLNEEKAVDYKEVQKWVFAEFDNPDTDTEQMRRDFVKKFGKANTKHFEKAVSVYMDNYNYLGEGKPAKYKDVRKWVFAQLEDSDMDSEEMEKEFIKKFGKENLEHYEAALSEYMD